MKKVAVIAFGILLGLGLVGCDNKKAEVKQEVATEQVQTQPAQEEVVAATQEETAEVEAQQEGETQGEELVVNQEEVEQATQTEDKSSN